MGKTYISRIGAAAGRLDIAVTYECLGAQSDGDAARRFYEWRLGRAGGHCEEIEITPSETHPGEETASFRVGPAGPLYAPLFLHEKAPYVLPLLAADMKKILGENHFSNGEADILRKTMDGIYAILDVGE